MEQIGLEEVLFVQKVYIMSTNEDLNAPVDLGWSILLTLCRVDTGHFFHISLTQGLLF